MVLDFPSNPPLSYQKQHIILCFSHISQFLAAFGDRFPLFPLSTEVNKIIFIFIILVFLSQQFQHNFFIDMRYALILQIFRYILLVFLLDWWGKETEGTVLQEIVAESGGFFPKSKCTKRDTRIVFCICICLCSSVVHYYLSIMQSKMYTTKPLPQQQLSDSNRRIIDPNGPSPLVYQVWKGNNVSN